MSLTLSSERVEKMNLTDSFEEGAITTSRANIVDKLAEEIESNISVTEVSFFNSEYALKQLREDYNQSLEKRKQLLGVSFFSFRPSQKKLLKALDQRLDILELEIIKLEKEISNEIKPIQDLIKANDQYLKNFVSK